VKDLYARKLRIADDLLVREVASNNRPTKQQILITRDVEPSVNHGLVNPTTRLTSGKDRTTFLLAHSKSEH
jgi:hypothetical protein